MPKFNRKADNKTTVNKEGAPAFTMRPELELFTRAATSMMGEPKFYDPDARESDANIIELVHRLARTKPEFVLNVASFVRNEMHLRTVPLVMLAETARISKGSGLVRKAAPLIVRRPDELTEMIAYWQNRYGDIGSKGKGEPFPNALKRGLADAAAQFDEWQVARYRAEKAPVKMRDVIRVIDRRRDFPFDEALRGYLMDGTFDAEALPVVAALSELGKKGSLDEEALDLIAKGRATWEQAVMQFGNRKEVWEAILPHMGYMAMLRNLRNFIQCGLDMDPVLQRLSDAEQVRRSRQLPFRFYTAYREMQKMRTDENGAVVDRTKDALSGAIETSVENVPRMSGHSVIAVDLSGSMSQPLSRSSTVSLRQISSLMGALAARICDEVTVIGFADRIGVYRPKPGTGVLAAASEIDAMDLGGATHAHKVMEHLILENVKADRLVLFSDMQCYADVALAWATSIHERLGQYRERINPLFRVYSVDLAGYGSAQFPEADLNTALLAGWSDRIIELIATLERSEELLKEIGSRKLLPAGEPEETNE